MKPESDTDEGGEHRARDVKTSTQPPTKQVSEARRMWRQVGQFGHIGIEFGVATGIGYFAGRWLDGKLDTAPAFAAILALCGTAAAAIDLYKLVQRIQRENKK